MMYGNKKMSLLTFDISFSAELTLFLGFLVILLVVEEMERLILKPIWYLISILFSFHIDNLSSFSFYHLDLGYKSQTLIRCLEYCQYEEMK